MEVFNLLMARNIQDSEGFKYQWTPLVPKELKSTTMLLQIIRPCLCYFAVIVLNVASRCSIPAIVRPDLARDTLIHAGYRDVNASIRATTTEKPKLVFKTPLEKLVADVSHQLSKLQAATKGKGSNPNRTRSILKTPDIENGKLQRVYQLSTFLP
ncbi:hypothetical protein Tco_0967044 [Tanacetum coccineum]